MQLLERNKEKPAYNAGIINGDKKMKAELIMPIETLRGKLKEDGYYFRMYKGEQIVQKCPRKWKDTPARKAARDRNSRNPRPLTLS